MKKLASAFTAVALSALLTVPVAQAAETSSLSSSSTQSTAFVKTFSTPLSSIRWIPKRDRKPDKEGKTHILSIWW